MLAVAPDPLVPEFPTMALRARDTVCVRAAGCLPPAVVGLKGIVVKAPPEGRLRARLLAEGKVRVRLPVGIVEVAAGDVERVGADFPDPLGVGRSVELRTLPRLATKALRGGVFSPRKRGPHIIVGRAKGLITLEGVLHSGTVAYRCRTSLLKHLRHSPPMAAEDS